MRSLCARQAQARAHSDWVLNGSLCGYWMGRRGDPALGSRRGNPGGDGGESSGGGTVHWVRARGRDGAGLLRVSVHCGSQLQALFGGAHGLIAIGYWIGNGRTLDAY
jgi:hypothetical protein